MVPIWAHLIVPNDATFAKDFHEITIKPIHYGE
jgi:hypothetical protein